METDEPLTLPVNLKVGQASRLPPAAKPSGMLALTRSLGRRDACPTLSAAWFRGSRREVGIGGILSPADGERALSPASRRHAPGSGSPQRRRRSTLSSSDGERAGVRGAFNCIVPV